MSDMTFSEKTAAWGRLLRLPNLFTAPWDPVCGFLLAGGTIQPIKIGALALIALFAYAFGLVTNDIADLKIDAQERPFRPLPSGEISLKAASITAVGLCFFTLELSPFAGPFICFGTMLLLVVILTYNYCGRRNSLVSPALMALCRVLSVGLGILAVYPEIPAHNIVYCAVFSAGYFLFIFGVSLAARGETEALESRPGGILVPAGAFLMGTGAVLWIVNVSFVMLHLVSFLLFVLFFLAALRAWLAFRKTMDPVSVQKMIGFLIRMLIPMQCAVILVVSHVTGILAFCCLPLAFLTARKFYGS